ncbi:sigma-70 family RNA polymerase sigma factor [Gramella sp. BOM4]|nr:sigma-70 family RNA polymerase sigma factor [Christiangramia bathymodioli]
MKDILKKKCKVKDPQVDHNFEVLQKVDGSGTKEDNERDLFLWSKIKKGETKALGDLYDHYISILFPYGLTLCSNKVLVMNSIHDLFVDLYKYRKNLADKPQVKYYLLKSLKRMIYKKVSKKETKFNKLEEKNFINLGLFESSVEKKIIESENAVDTEQRLTQALDRLPKKQRKAIQLKFYQGKSYEEIAQLMNVTIETSRTLIYRSITSLRKIMAAMYFLTIFLSI